MFGCLDTKFTERPRRFVEANTGYPITFYLAFYPHENFGIDRLRTGISTKQASGQCRKQEQTVSGNNKYDGHIKYILRPQYHTKKIKFSGAKIKQNSLTVIPLQPWQAIKNNLCKKNENDPPAGKDTGYRSGINLRPEFFDNPTGFFLSQPRRTRYLSWTLYLRGLPRWSLLRVSIFGTLIITHSFFLA